MSDEKETVGERAGSAVGLLREILQRDREAIAEIRRCVPQYKPEPELLDLHRRMEEAIRRESPNAKLTDAAIRDAGKHK